MQVAAAEQRCVSNIEQCAQLQRLADERAQQLQAAEVATTESTSRLASATSTAEDLQRQLSLAVQQRDGFSSLANDRYTLITCMLVNARQKVRELPSCLFWRIFLYCIHSKPCQVLASKISRCISRLINRPFMDT